MSVDDLKSPADNALATGPFGSSIGARFFEKQGVPVIRGSNLSTDGSIQFIDDGLVFVSEAKAAELRRSTVSKGDLIFTCWGTINQIGLIGPHCAYSRYIISNKQMKLTPDARKADSLFLFYLFSSPQIQRKILSQSIGSSIPGFNLGQLRAMRLLIPPLTEQRAIAEALSDVDALLGALDRLIAKKCDLKQAAMQQLLTGQLRLSGFHGEWEVKRLGDVADVLKGSGLSKAAISLSGTRKCILYGELFTTYGRVIRDVLSRTDAIDGKLAQIGDILMPGSTTTVGIDLAIASALLTEGVFLGGDINIIRKKGAQRYDPEFLANYLTHVKKFEIADKTQGITIIHLYGRTMLDLSISLPTIPEQAAIAEVLSEMDAELLRLEQRRDKTRALKQGMMQELLTGKTRLIASVSAHA